MPSDLIMARNGSHSIVWVVIHLLNKQWAREVLTAHPVYKRAGQACALLAALLTRHAILLWLHGAAAMSYTTYLEHIRQCTGSSQTALLA